MRTWAALFVLGMASGLPAPLLDQVLVQWLAAAGWSRDALLAVGWLTVVSLLKPLWGPLVDRYSLLGRRRGWILLAQVVAMAGLLGAAAVGPEAGSFLVLVVVVAVAAATQDLAINAATAAAAPGRAGHAAAVSVWGYRIALAALVAGVPRLAETHGWPAAYALAACGLVPGMAAALLLPEPAGPVPGSWREAVVRPVALLAADHRLGWLLAGVALVRLPDVLASLATSAFLVEIAPPVTLGDARAWSLAGALAGGGLAAGLLAWGLRPALLLAVLLMAVSNIGYVALDQGWVAGAPWLYAVVIGDTTCGACAGTVLVGWLLGLCRPGYEATQYALLIAVSLALPQAARHWIAPLVDHHGWSAWFLITVVAAAPALAAAWWATVRPRPGGA
jgi:MFS transporter, PAT family, beta-lactamase induction signal transducer AmpG